MAEHQRFYVVIEAGAPAPIARTFDDFIQAGKAAQELAVAHQGKTFVVFIPEEAYRSTEPTAQRVYLSWPVQDVAAAEPPPTAAPLEI